MQSIKTELTKLLNITSPIIAAPMFTASTPELAAAVTKAGGFGLVAAGLYPSQKLKDDLRSIRQALGVPTDRPVPTGVGLIGWILDETESSDDPRLPAVLEERPSVIWFAFGTNLGKYISQVRTYDAKRSHRTLVFVIVHSVEEARCAATEWKVDCIVVQGPEAGGHGSSNFPPLFTLLQAVLLAIPDGPPIVAAGGVTTGVQIAALLTMGAAGAVLGTRFLFTPECMFSDTMKSVLVEAGINSTARNDVFDELQGLAWPEGINGRAIANDLMTDYHNGIDLENRTKMYKDAQQKGDKDRLLIWAGVGAGLVNKIESASDVVRELHNDTVKALKVASSIVA